MLTRRGISVASAGLIGRRPVEEVAGGLFDV
jgi:hypothetical protein